MNIIVAADEKWGIGNKGNLLVRIPNDQKLFRQETLGKTVVYGRKTLQTFPGGMLLEGRENIILSRNPDYKVKNAQVVHSLEELKEKLGSLEREDVWVIGGGEIYEQLLPFCDTVHVTRIDHTYEADVRFPDLDSMPEWKITADSDEQYYFDLTYHFLKYERR